jgi:hypothetical protein
VSIEEQNCEIKALSSAEVLVPVYQAVWCQIAENINPDTRRTEYLMSQSSTPLHIFASFSWSPLSKLLVFDKLLILLLLLFVALRPNAGHGLLILEVSRSQTTTHHSRYDSSGRVISSSQRPVPDNTHNRQTSMPPAGFELTVSAGKRPQTYALDGAATGTGKLLN